MCVRQGIRTDLELGITPCDGCLVCDLTYTATAVLDCTALRLLLHSGSACWYPPGLVPKIFFFASTHHIKCLDNCMEY
jgi:hypothetical protein